MAYQIVYDGREVCPDKNRRGRMGMTVTFFLLFCLLVCGFWPEGRELLRTVLLPGDPDETVLAASELIDHLQQGSGLGDAVSVFLQTVTDYGSGY